MKNHFVSKFLLLLTIIRYDFVSAQPERHDKLVVDVGATVTKMVNRFAYYYIVLNNVASLQQMRRIRIETGDLGTEWSGTIDSLINLSNKNWKGWTVPRSAPPPNPKNRGIISWFEADSISSVDELYFPTANLVAQGENIQVGVFSEGLPSIKRYWAEGWTPPLREQTLDSLLAAGLPKSEIFPPWYQDAYQALTLAPQVPDSPFIALTFLDTLFSYTIQSRALGWITAQATADKYLTYFSSARAKLVQGDSVGARTPLQQLLRDVDIDSSSALTSEAYALLRYNTEYLLNQLPVGQEGIAPYGLFATHSMWLEENSKVYSGSIGVDSAGSPPFLDSQVELSVGQRVTIASGSLVKANRIKIKQGATVNGDVYYNELENNGTITGSQQTPLSLPLVAWLPEFKISTPGTQDITVVQNGSQTLALGSYGDIDIKKNGRLLLTGGTYHLKSITAGEDTWIMVQSRSEIRIADKFSSGEGSYIGPEDTTRLSAKQITFYVGGINGKTGTLGADPKAAKVGMRNTVKATFYVPNGTLWIREGSEVEGVFLGKDVEVGIGVKVWWKSGF